MDITKFINGLGKSMDRNSPAILTGMGVAGLVGTVVLAVRGTVEAYKALSAEANFRADEFSEQTGEHQGAYPGDFTTKEIVEITWRHYIPTVASGAFTIACMVGSNHISSRRNAALVSVLTLTETALREYKEKVSEKFGEKKATQVEDEIREDRLKANPVENTTIILTGKGEHMFFDSFSGRYFKSDVETIRRLVNDFNQKLIQCAPMFLGINDFYDELGLERIELGDEMGWSAEDNMLDVRTSSAKMIKDGTPCGILEYRVWPKHY